MPFTPLQIAGLVVLPAIVIAIAVVLARLDSRIGRDSGETEDTGRTRR